MKNLFYLFLLLTISSTLFVACEKDEEEEPTLPPTTEEALGAIEEYVLVNKLFSDAANETESAARYADDTIQNKSGNNKTYPQITIEPFDAVNWPKTVTVNYGETNFLCQDERYRRGKIIFETTGWYHIEGTVINVSFDDYYQNDFKVDGNQIITNQGRNEDDNLVFSVVIENGEVTTPDNKVIYYEENTTREWIEGEDTPLEICDDVYLIDGIQSGISSDDISYDLIVQEDLNIQVCCHWIRGGILDVNIQGLPTISINYGDGECNSSATITIMGVEYEIEME